MTDLRVNVTSAESLVLKAAELSAMFDREPPPLREIAQSVGIERVDRRETLPVSGLLLETRPRSFVALIRASDPPARQRFSLAHEIAHVLVHSAGVTSDLSCRNATIERLCDRLAAELLLPAGMYDTSRPSLQPALDIARRCRASEVAAVLRLADLDPTVIVLAWSTRARPGSQSKLRLLWGRAPRGIYVPEFATPPLALELHALAVGEVAGMEARLDLGSLRGTFETESVRLRPAEAGDVEVLSVVSGVPGVRGGRSYAS